MDGDDVLAGEPMEEENLNLDNFEVVFDRNDNEEELDSSDDDLINGPDGVIATSRRLGDLIEAITQSDSFGIMNRRNLRVNQINDGSNDVEDDTDLDNAVRFDTDLPVEHSYLGTMVRVSGVEYLEPGKQYRLLLFTHHSLVFPGETLPMILPHYMFDTIPLQDKGLLFGVMFKTLWEDTKPNLYGVTCQIFEKGNDEHGGFKIKCRAHQRFIISPKFNSNFTDLLGHVQRKTYAIVQVLPEIILPDPLSSINLGSMNRFKGLDSMDNKLRSIQASTTVWPQFVYQKYDLNSIIQRAKKRLFSFKIDSMPTDYTLLSFWLGRNLLFNPKERLNLFLTNTVNVRLQIIEKYLGNEKYFSCRRCLRKIAAISSLFAMSKHGVQSNYCNPEGYIHETNTVYAIKSDSIRLIGEPSTEFSWFPGYSWQIACCRMCDIHIGWKFSSVVTGVVPKKFFGLSGTSVVVDLSEEEIALRRAIFRREAGIDLDPNTEIFLI